MISLAQFKRQLLDAGVLHPKGLHHEFAYGTHGRKLDFDLIPDGSELYKTWVAIIANALKQDYDSLEQAAVLGVANGTNRLARDVGKNLGLPALFTHKISPRTVELTPESLANLKKHLRSGNSLVIALEDVGTTGGTALSALNSAQKAGAKNLSAQFSWKRTPQLGAFAKAKIPYTVLINEPLDTYTPEQCDYCAKGWRLIAH